jgi:hypothetical protein
MPAFHLALAGLTRLAEVRTEDLSQSDDCTHVALQWDAIGADGESLRVAEAAGHGIQVGACG